MQDGMNPTGGLGGAGKGDRCHPDQVRYLQGRSHHQEGVGFFDAPVHKVDLVAVHCVPEEDHVWFQAASTPNAGWDPKAPHLLLCEKDVAVGRQAVGLGAPGGVQGREARLQRSSRGLFATVQAEDPATREEAH